MLAAASTPSSGSEHQEKIVETGTLTSRKENPGSSMQGRSTEDRAGDRIKGLHSQNKPSQSFVPPEESSVLRSEQLGVLW